MNRAQDLLAVSGELIAVFSNMMPEALSFWLCCPVDHTEVNMRIIMTRAIDLLKMTRFLILNRHPSTKAQICGISTTVEPLPSLRT